MKSVLMNPPFSAGWNRVSDERFEGFGLAPKSKADYAFLLHGYSKLEKSGMMVIVLPHGVLFRGGAEGKVRKSLLERGAIQGVIGLPSNIFYGTSIPTVLLILEKGREDKNVFFIDASEEYKKSKNRNELTDDHIQKIFKTYQSRKEIEKFARLVPYDELVENDYNLNIPRYIDTFEEEKPIDLGAVALELMAVDEEIKKAEKELVKMMNELVVTNEDPKEVQNLELMKKALGGPVTKNRNKNNGQLDLMKLLEGADDD